MSRHRDMAKAKRAQRKAEARTPEGEQERLKKRYEALSVEYGKFKVIGGKLK